MSKITFEEDPSSRKVTQLLFLSQVAGVGFILGFRFFHLFFPAFVVSCLTLILFAVSLLWLYARYRDLPMIREKGDLNHLLLKFQKGAIKEGGLIQSAVKERELLTRAEQEEIRLMVNHLQKKHMERGLAAASIREAEIPGVDPTLKEQLAGYGILNAADVMERMTQHQGIGTAQRQALLSWQGSLMNDLESTKPVSLTDSQLENIQQTYQALHAKNDAIHRKARTSKQLLEHEMLSFKARLRELASLTFPRYLGRALAPRGGAAALMAVALIVTQVVSSVSTTRSALGNVALPIPSASSTPSPLLVTATEPSTTTAAPSPIVTASAIRAMISSLTPTIAVPPTATATQTLPSQATLPTTIASCVPQNTSRETGLVVGIVDGDTIDVRINGQDVRVRYIGVNTPEQDQPLYSEATAYNQKLVGDKTVTLVKDTSETDPFNRLLRYVIVGDTFVNNELVTMGYAEALAYAPDTACVSTFETAQRKAQLVKVGLWSPTPEVYIPAITGGEGTPACDLSYPGVCIPPAPPDLDCGDIQYRRFQVLPPDPHGFDRDGDGVGCES
jgi:micrococcal nuclease